MGMILWTALAWASAVLHTGGRTARGPPGDLEWSPRQVEHLMNRAGFGATGAEIAAALEATPAEFVERLCWPSDQWQRLEPTLIRWEDFDLDPRGVPVPPEQSKYQGMSRKEASQIKSELARIDHRQFMEYMDAYFASMIAGADPLNDRMTLFWHGFFTTASPVVMRKFELLNQHQFLREHALGNFKDLLHGIVRDPGMLQYLDNNTNVKGHPNENLARELMELYSLGEGNYTEVDVREAARALTGCHANPEGLYEFKAEHHDDGEKTVLGTTGKLQGAELVEILLAQEACPRWVALRILTYFEGVAPSEERLAEYAAFLREQDYEILPFMRRLFLDPEFYRPLVVGARVQSPIDYFVGMCHKLDLDPADFVPYRMTLELGEGLYQPPSVKGWEGGETWMTNALLMQRGNFAGVLLGTLPRGGTGRRGGPGNGPRGPRPRRAGRRARRARQALPVGAPARSPGLARGERGRGRCRARARGPGRVARDRAVRARARGRARAPGSRARAPRARLHAALRVQRGRGHPAAPGPPGVQPARSPTGVTR